MTQALSCGNVLGVLQAGSIIRQLNKDIIDRNSRIRRIKTTPKKLVQSEVVFSIDELNFIQLDLFKIAFGDDLSGAMRPRRMLLVGV